MLNNSTIDHPTRTSYHLQRWVVVLTLLSCSLSAIGSLIQIMSYYMCKGLRILSRELLVYMSVADMFSAVALGAGVLNDFHRTTDGCVAQAFFSTFFSTSSMFWLVALLIYLLVTVVTIDPERSARLVLYFHTICWGIPGLVSMLALCFKGLGSTNSKLSVGWCWVKIHNSQSLFWMLVTEKIWEFAAFVCLIILSIIIRIQISRKCSNEELDYLPFGTAEAMRKINKKILFMPFVFILLRVWGIVRFVLFLQKSPYTMNSILISLQGIGNTGQGFTNFILFWLCTARTREIMSSQIADFIKNNACMQKLCPCCQSCLALYDETKPLLPETDSQHQKHDLCVYFKSNDYDYTSSQSASKSARISYSYLK